MSLRPPPIKKWAADPALDRLLIFAQALEEKLFDYTIDSYKAPALNLHASAYEIGALGRQLRFGVLQSGALIPVIEEFASRVKADPVLSKKEREHFGEYASRLEATRTKPDDLLALCDALILELGGFYWERLLACIREEVRAEKNSKRLLALADSFIVEAGLQGFHRKFIYYQVKRSFWWSSIDSPDAIDPFLERFENSNAKFRFIFRGSAEFLEIRQFCEQLGFVVSSEAPDLPETKARVTEYLGPNTQYPAFLSSRVLEARDAFSARGHAERLVETLSNIYTFHVHQGEPAWHSVALCTNEDGTGQLLLHPALSPMRRCVHGSIDGSKERIERIIEVLAGVHVRTQAAQVFFRALEYHRAALESHTPENQLVDLWAAFEGFLPPPDPETTRITHYVRNIMPALSLSYAEYIFRDVAASLERAGPAVRALVEGVLPEQSFFESATCLLVSRQHEEERETLYAALHKHPLLRFRCHALHEGFAKAKHIKATLDSHRRRLEWHIQRVYATRNQIMHSARALPYLGTLVENFHSYLDTLLWSVVTVAVQAREQSGIPGIIRLLDSAEKSYLRGLQEEDMECDDSNFREVLFGSTNPLSPFRNRLSL